MAYADMFTTDKNTDTLSPQEQMVFEHLTKIDPGTGVPRSISPLESIGLYRIYRLAAVVENLRRKRRLPVVTVLKSDRTGKTYARYFLPREGDKVTYLERDIEKCTLGLDGEQKRSGYIRFSVGCHACLSSPLRVEAVRFSID